MNSLIKSLQIHPADPASNGAVKRKEDPQPPPSSTGQSQKQAYHQTPPTTTLTVIDNGTTIHLQFFIVRPDTCLILVGRAGKYTSFADPTLASSFVHVKYKGNVYAVNTYEQVLVERLKRFTIQVPLAGACYS